MGKSLFAGRYSLQLGFLSSSVLEALEHAAWVFGRALQCVENAVAHFHCCLKGGLLTAVLAVGEILGELVPLAADAQSPPLERGGLICVSGNVALGHCVVAGLSTGCAYTAIT